MTTGGGGMMVANSEEFAKRAKHLTTQAKTNSFYYGHNEIGYNYRLVNILAALGVAQLEQLPGGVSKKKEIAEFYMNQLKDLNIKFQVIPQQVDSNYWLLTLCSDKRQELFDAFSANKIQVRPIWTPLNHLLMYENHIYISANDNSRVIHSNSISLPCSTGITEEELHKVGSIFKGVYLQDKKLIS